MRLRRLCLLLGSLLFAAKLQAAILPPHELEEFPAVTARDRVMVLAPHEDDETLGAGGLIQQALAVGATVQVMFLTYGDHNEYAFAMYRRNPILTPGINRNMGRLRRREALAACGHLGVAPEQVLFLGYPDHGTLAIWKSHWLEEPSFHSLLTNVSEVPYGDAIAYGKLHKGENILEDVQRQILAFKPTILFVTHPLDSNPDHRAYYLYASIALLNLAGQMPAPQVYCYPIHMGPWPRPMRYHPDRSLPFPGIVQSDPSYWWTLALSPQQTVRKGETIRMYRSQMADHGYWLVSFARTNELFTQPAPIVLRQTAWAQGHGVVARSNTEAYEEGESTGALAGTAYRMTPDSLIVEAHLRHRFQRRTGLRFYVFGWRPDQSFAQMPKMRIDWRAGHVRLWDQSRVLAESIVTTAESSDEIVFEIPWNVIGQPRRIFVQGQGLAGGIPVSQTTWQTLIRPDSASLQPLPSNDGG